MLQPISFREFKLSAKKGNLIALQKEILADLETPVSAYLKTQNRATSSFLLESVENGEKIGRYSFIGLYLKEYVELTHQGKIKSTKNIYTGNEKTTSDILKVIENHLKQCRLANRLELPPFCGGFTGFLSYENVAVFEDIQLAPKKYPTPYKSLFFLTHDFLVFDHMARTIRIVTICQTNAKNVSTLKKSYAQGIKKIDQIEKSLKKSLSAKTLPESRSKHKPMPNISRQMFEKNVERVKKYIRAGDVVQAVISQRFDLGTFNDPLSIYRALRVVNPSPYMFLLKHKTTCLIGSSPEVHVKKTGRIAEVRPIAGTRKRGQTDEQDAVLEKELVHSKKEQAEHLMLVDLARNDLGRVCEFHSIQVDNYAHVEKYSHVMHLVTNVTGKLRKNASSCDLIRATFPAGTVSGAPKVRAMQIIDELEKDGRGPYAGCLGYIGFSGDCDMCITIRTIIVEKGQASIQAGAGIVFDSVPAHEYKETINKAKALVRAVDLSQEALL